MFSNYQHQSFFRKIRFCRIFVFFRRGAAVREIRNDRAIRENHDDIRFSTDFVFNVDMFDDAKNENENEIDFSSLRFYRFRNFRSTIFEFVENDDVFRFDVQMKKKKKNEIHEWKFFWFFDDWKLNCRRVNKIVTLSQNWSRMIFVLICVSTFVILIFVNRANLLILNAKCLNFFRFVFFFCRIFVVVFFSQFRCVIQKMFWFSKIIIFDKFNSF